MYSLCNQTKLLCCCSTVAITLEQPSEYSRIGWNDAGALAVVPHRLAVNPKVLIIAGKYLFSHHLSIIVIQFISKHRRAGVAHMLVKKGEEIALKLGYPYVRVDTNEINTKMRGLLEKLGYKYCGSTRLDDCKHDILFACYEKGIGNTN